LRLAGVDEDEPTLDVSWEARELFGIHQSGAKIPLELSFGAFERSDGRFVTLIARDVTERKRAEEALRLSREERLAELERVRRRIATDLHDDIGSSLTQISILSEVIRQNIGSNDSAAREPLSMIARSSRELVDAMSDIVWAINPQKDQLSDLTQRMRRFASDVFTARNIAFNLRLPPADHDIKLGANLRREVFLIFKESINNMVRHSGCSRADVAVQLEEDSLSLRLSDNGKGFDSTSQSDGHGLLSMRERARDIDGQFDLTSTPGHGTTILLKVPLDRAPRTDIQ
jgi:signal transduction histidine kinase